MKTPKPRLYFLNSHSIPQVSNCSDLGVIVDDKLSFSNHILSITKKAYTQSILLKRCFVSNNPTLLKRAFVSYVRPILEYASPAWSPHSAKNILLIEKVQRRFTKHLRNLRSLPYASRLNSTGLQSLQHRRTISDLCTCFRVLHNLTPLRSHLFFTIRNLSTRGHPITLVKPQVRLDVGKYSFFSRIIDIWNSLPLAIVSCPTIASFKSKLKLLAFSDP